ncbi:hypothetical protein QNO08_03095 [Arthrobacter sp. zg-Y820]|uniref:hypothetical protein n=1 Tax=unclassified Arthrobacter TaxID=235627 RepID=UPI001E496D22|nr:MULTISPECIES: hypothetical protein [unclassified Arthrobacter]MCC9195320.1 hypothetical protein [Arthrobacter sp. zg-Y820]MDK1278179.1 hypothetical protein [Arthrobacter sp. zg.Y820]WIB10065.1 hypothetical protein QNO08_03095 [Arthrobacter sp. zg-Y820]
MSISLLLVPMAIAAVGAFKIGRTETDAQGQRMCQVQTRMRDAGLLAAALADTNATVSPAADTITADWLGVRAVFHRNEQGIWQVDFTGDIDEKRAADIVAAIDLAYGRQVQQAVLARLREKAPSAGMTVASETVEDDDSVTLVLNVEGTK